MNIENNIFKRYKPDYKKIIKYGFSKNKDKYLFEKLFLDNEFKAIIEISKTGEVSGFVYDLENNDEYLPLRIESQKGTFTNTIRAEYEKILNEIRQNCFIENFFIYPQANRINDFIYKNYGDKPMFMWEKFPNYGVFKNKNNKK